MPGDENDPLRKIYVSAFTQAIADLGWSDSRNVRVDIRWAGDDASRIRALAQEETRSVAAGRRVSRLGARDPYRMAETLLRLGERSANRARPGGRALRWLPVINAD